jgi:hypothetical protein
MALRCPKIASRCTSAELALALASESQLTGEPVSKHPVSKDLHHKASPAVVLQWSCSSFQPVRVAMFTSSGVLSWCIRIPQTRDLCGAVLPFRLGLKVAIHIATLPSVSNGRGGTLGDDRSVPPQLSHFLCRERAWKRFNVTQNMGGSQS